MLHTAMEPPVQERKTSSFMISDILDSTSPRKPKHLGISILPEHCITHVDEREVATHSPLSAGDIVDKEPGDSPLGESDYSQSSQGSEGTYDTFRVYVLLAKYY